MAFRYFLNPVAAPETELSSMLLVVLGVFFLIMAVVSVATFAAKSKKDKDESEREEE